MAHTLAFAQERLSKGIFEDGKCSGEMADLQVLKTPMTIPTTFVLPEEDDTSNEDTQIQNSPRPPRAKAGPAPSEKAAVGTLSLSTPFFTECPDWTVQEALELLHNCGTEKVVVIKPNRSPVEHPSARFKTLGQQAYHVCLERTPDKKEGSLLFGTSLAKEL